MNGGDRRQRRSVERVHYPMYAIEKIAHQRRGVCESHLFRPGKKLAQVRARGKSRFHPAVDDQSMRLVLENFVGFEELFELRQSPRSDFVAGLVLQRELDAAVDQFPGERLTTEDFHFTATFFE